MYVLARFNLEAQYILRALADKALHLVGAQRERVAHVHARRSVVLEVLRGVARRVEFFGRVEGYVSLAAVKQLVGVFFVNAAAFRLAVGTVFAAEAHTFVELYSEPAERLEYIFFRPGHKAVRVGVFYAENKFAAVLAGE